MEVLLNPALQARIDELVHETGYPAESLVEDALAGYAIALSQTRELLDSRYDEMLNGMVTPIDGEEAYRRLIAATSAERESRS